MPAVLIAPGLYAISVGPVNTLFLDSPDGCALIDTGFPGSADKILQAIARYCRPSGNSASSPRTFGTSF